MDVIDASPAASDGGAAPRSADRPDTGSARGAGGASSPRRGAQDAGARMSSGAAGDEDAGGRDKPERPATNPEPSETIPDAGMSQDAGNGASTEAEPPTRTGSCCSASDEPGCGDSTLQDCVCALRPSCCDRAWDEACTRIVAEKNCQPGVRECVCGSADGQWQQAECCQGSWDSTCESVANNKCGATPDCE
jgi:hypothetical protein